MLFKGSGVAIVTPFKNNKVDFEAFGRLIDFHLANKTDAIIVSGTTGEGATMTDEEKIALIEFAKDRVGGKIPIIAGTGSNNTVRAIEMSDKAKKAGADGLLLVTPFYNKCTQKGLVEHYKMILNTIDLPAIAYNVPSRTGVNIEPNTALALSKIENLIGIKEASGNLSQCLEIMSLVPDNFAVYSGNDDQILPILSLGGSGVISVLANILPLETHEMCEAYFNLDLKKAKELQLKYAKLIKLLFSEVNPIPVKEALNLMGYDVGDVRSPLTRMEPANRDKLEEEMVKLKIKKMR